jgi:Fic family protein
MRALPQDAAADIPPADLPDRGESVALIEPLLISEASRHRTPVTDLAIDLAARSAGLRRSLAPGVSKALAELIRTTSAYYSNLVEGRDTDPVDIERALNKDYSNDVSQRTLQREAKAHILVQQWIDGGGLAGRATTADGVKEAHRRLFELLPDELLWVTMPGSEERVRIAPGELRRQDIEVGPYLTVSPGAIPRFLARFERGFDGLGRTDAIIAAATAHHRLLWIHPFLDGNRRVAQLMSHAILLETVDTGGVWSLVRGLVHNAHEYERHLADSHLLHRDDVDARGQLSREALASFTRFFIETCLAQIAVMEALTQPDRLRTRILMWAEEEARLGGLPPKAGAILEAILLRGELARGDVDALLGTSERHARRVISALFERGVLSSEGARAPLRLVFPAALAPRWLPGLLPERH